MTSYTGALRPTARRMRAIPATLLLTVLAVGVLFPFYLVLSTSLKDDQQVADNPLAPPKHWMWSNFSQAWVDGHFNQYFVNSVLVVVPTVLLVLALSMFAAYAFAVRRFRGSTALFALLMVGLTVPLDILIIPLYYEMLDFHILNTLWALILPQVAMSLPFGILLLRAFIQDLPRALLEAARIDGCSEWRLLIHIVIPLCRPPLLSLLVFVFMWTWNQFLLPLVLTQSDSARTIPIGLSVFQGRYVTELPLLMAGVTIAFVPVVVVYVFFQRHIINGITAGALK